MSNLSNRWFAPGFVGLAVTLGWLWHICYQDHLAELPLCYVAFGSMTVWLWARLEKLRKQAPPPDRS